MPRTKRLSRADIERLLPEGCYIAPKDSKGWYRVKHPNSDAYKKYRSLTDIQSDAKKGWIRRSSSTRAVGGRRP